MEDTKTGKWRTVSRTLNLYLLHMNEQNVKNHTVFTNKDTVESAV